MNKMRKTAIDIREFNRFYLPYFRLLSQKFFNSDYSVVEARILYEIFSSETISARDIAKKLHVDKSYLSRMLKKFEVNGFLERNESVLDSRRSVISLTEKGLALTEQLIEESNMQIERELDGISDAGLEKLSYHMAEISKILEDKVRGDY